MKNMEEMRQMKMQRRGMQHGNHNMRSHGMGHGNGKQHKMVSDDPDLERCPLSGAAKAIQMIPDAAMLVIGTEECAYYTKSMLEMKGGGDTCFSVILDKNDVTFGSVEKVTDAVHELMSEYKPKSLFLVTTCVVEVIGDDFTALALDASEQYQIPVKVIQTNHFKGKDAEYGMEQVMEAAEEIGVKPNKMGMAFKMIGSKLSGSKRIDYRMGGRR
ncbi:MAG: nitrogenase component 1 [Eubacteriales bacterium]